MHSSGQNRGDHQGGCVCENTALLRVGTDNVELAATFAPKPFIHPSATGDWIPKPVWSSHGEFSSVVSMFSAMQS